MLPDPPAPCDHNTMVDNNDPKFAWRCAKCGYVYGGETTVVQRKKDNQLHRLALALLAVNLRNANSNISFENLPDIWKVAKLPDDCNPMYGLNSKTIAEAIDRLVADDANL